MPLMVKTFSGMMDTDDSDSLMPDVAHKLARNGRFYGNPNAMRLESVPGTTLIPYTYPAGTNQTIGACYDQVNQILYFFNWNSNGNNGIYQWKVATNVITPVLVSNTNSSGDIFNFDRNYPVCDAIIMYAPATDGNTLFFNARNDRPKKLNLLYAQQNLYNNQWLSDYLTVARQMPLISPICSYQNDATINLNNLRKTLWEFRYRWVNRDYTKSTCSPYGKLFAPQNPDDVAVDIDATKNNLIEVVINTGAADIQAIEVIARQTLATVNAQNQSITEFSEDFLVATLKKSDLGLSDNVPYTFKFYNDQSYPDIDTEESIELFDYVPKIANNQELLNGNTLVYGGILSGYDFDVTLNVTNSVTQVYNDEVQNPFTITLVDMQTTSPPFTGNYFVYMAGIPQNGDVYSLTLVFQNVGGGTSTFNYTYNVVGSPTLGNVEIAFFDQLEASGLLPTYHCTASSSPVTNPAFLSVNPTSNVGHVLTGSYTITYATPPPPATNDVNIACWHERSKYAFGLVYFDEFGVTNGVVTQVATMLIDTPEIDTTLFDQPKIPAISFSIFHQPPLWATDYAWVRTNSLTFLETWEMITDRTFKDTQYGYMDITGYEGNTNGFPDYSYNQGDRVRIIGEWVTAGTVIALDFPIVAVVQDPTIDSSMETGTFIKIPYDVSITDFGTTENYAIEVYTPALQSTSTTQFYYEFGENYIILNPGTVNAYHAGQIQNQTAVLPATFTFTRGDYYIRQRTVNLTTPTTDIMWIIDNSISDLYSSFISGTGRAFVEDPFAQETYFPVQMRWSLAYQQDTNINQTNRFYPLNFTEVDRSKGDIQRLKARDRILRIFQNRGCAQMGIYVTFVQDNSGSNTLTTTNDILTINNVPYYEGEYGMGTQYTSLVSGKIQDYFVDPVRGYHVRLSDDGMVPISELYKGQFYIRGLLTPYNQVWTRPDGSMAKILGCYNYFDEEYVCVLQAGINSNGSIGNYTFSFNEKRNGYSSFFDYFPDWLIGVEENIFSFLNGKLYIHDNTTTYNNFYGTQYDLSITLVFNTGLLEKKSWISITTISSSAFSCPSIITNVNTYGNTPQTSMLVEQNFALLEGNYHASFMRDINSNGGWINGDTLKGNYVEIQFSKVASPNLEFLDTVSVKYITSYLTTH